VNTYNENLLTTVRGVLNGLASQQKKLGSLKKTKGNTLYFAQGASLTAADRLKVATMDYDHALQVHSQGVKNYNEAVNVEASAKALQENVTATVTNTATTASNIQVAANAVTKLAADIGSALNIISAEDYGSDIFRLAKNTNKRVSDTAYHAEQVSKKAMKATSLASEIVANKLQTEATASKTGVDSLHKATHAQLSTITATMTTDTQSLSTARSAEKVADGAFQDAINEKEGIDEAYAKTSTNLNQSLVAVPSDQKNSALELTLTWQPMSFPYTKGDTQKNLDNLVSLSPDNAANTDSKSIVEYFAVLVKEPSAEGFSLDQAEMAFSHQDPASPRKVFIPLDKLTASKENNCHTQTFSCNICNDTDGDKITAGTSYVVFLYTKLPETYKSYINNYENLLSAPTTSFVFAEKLMAVASDTITPGESVVLPSGGDASQYERCPNLSFSLPTIPKVITEFRCIFIAVSSTSNQAVDSDAKGGISVTHNDVKQALKNVMQRKVLCSNPDLNLCVSPDADVQSSETKKQKEAIPIHFNEGIAAQVTPANYSTAILQAPSSDNEAGNGIDYLVKIDGETTDNFGNLVLPNVGYIPVIYSVFGGSPDQADEYINVLSLTKSTDSQGETSDDWNSETPIILLQPTVKKEESTATSSTKKAKSVKKNNTSSSNDDQ